MGEAAEKINWLEERKTGIGGSDAGAICGVSKWKTPFQVWEEKLGILGPQPDNPAMAYGRMQEPVIRQWYADTYGHEVMVPSGILRHPKYDFMLANLDGFVAGKRGLEIKTARSREGWGEPGTDEVPLVYLLQVQHYMIVTGFEVFDVAVSIGGTMPEVYEVPADTELQGMLIEKEHDFWALVQNNTPPEPVSYADMVQRFKRSLSEAVTADVEIEEALKNLRHVRELNTHGAEVEEKYKAQIMGYMGERDTLVATDGSVLVTWKETKGRSSFNTKQLQLDHPELCKQYVTIGESSRRFLLK